MSDFYYGDGSNFSPVMPFVPGTNTQAGRLDLMQALGSLLPALRDRGGSADYAPEAFPPGANSPAPASAPPVTVSPAAGVPGPWTGSGVLSPVPFQRAGEGGGPFGLNPDGPAMTTADSGTAPGAAVPGSSAPPLETKDVKSSPTDNPRAPPPQVPVQQRPERTTVQGAPQASLFQRLGQGDWGTSRMLLAMAAGFGGAHNFGEGMGRAFGNASNTIPGIQQQQMSMAGINLTANYLQSKGLSGQDALAVAVNPELAKGIIPLVTGTSNKFENGLVINGRGEPIADFRYLLPSHTAEVKGGGEESTVSVDPYGNVSRLHVNPAGGGANTVQGQRNALPQPGHTWTAPDGTRWRLGGSDPSGQNGWQQVQ